MADILKTLIIAVQDMVTDLDRKVNCISFVFMHIKQIPLPLVILLYFFNIKKTPPKTYEESATYMQLCFENYVVEDNKMSDIARKGTCTQKYFFKVNFSCKTFILRPYT